MIQNFICGDIHYSIFFFDKSQNHVCDFFYNYYSESSSSANVKYCYDLTDKKDSKWYAIVIRNIPRTISDDQLLQVLRDNCTNGKVSYLLQSKNIGLSRCSVAVLDNLESAERLCVDYNKKDINNMNLKVIYLT
jgi:hypothetical protein